VTNCNPGFFGLSSTQPVTLREASSLVRFTVKGLPRHAFRPLQVSQLARRGEVTDPVGWADNTTGKQTIWQDGNFFSHRLDYYRNGLGR